MTRETLTLYQLGYDAETPMSMAPHVWKTLLPLRRLGVEFKRELVTLTQLREELPHKLGYEKVTLPTLLITAEDGATSTVMDSYRIAQYLEQRFATSTLSLFAPAGNGAPEDVIAGRNFARFMEEFVDKDLAHEIRPCVLHTSYATFATDGPMHDPKSRAHFLAKCGQDKMDELMALNSDPVWKEDQYVKARKQMGIINSILKERFESGIEDIFLAGAKPTQVDFVIFAFYPYSLTNPELVRNTWRHPSLPFIGKWLDAIFDSGLVKREELRREHDVAQG